MKKMYKITQGWHISRIVSSHDTVKDLSIHHQTVLNHLKKAGYKKSSVVLVPYILKQKNFFDLISMWKHHRNEFQPFLKRLVTDGEQWITYDNIVQIKMCSTICGKAQIDGKKKRMFQRTGIVYYKLPLPNKMVDSDSYCQWLIRLLQTTGKVGRTSDLIRYSLPSWQC